ncbi:RHS repeat-associated core domain-containing protein [Parabacteroides pacaensis]|uniref:RHS repeat-associated core domain-containing protein n=1 Tax=Parabacteroides pacaensis TaxID=2086575 RepID=UPI0037423495
MIYENGALKQILTPEGYITLSGSTPTYHYYLRDHQGNNRVVINQNSTVEQVTHYYPFGMTYGEGTSPDVQPYKYNGKELDRTHGLNWYDYEARMYAGYRFPIPDPLADKYPAISPYAYCANNPVLFIDPKGEKIVIGTPLGHFWGYFGINTYESKVQKQIVYLKSLNPELKTTIEYLEKSEMIVRIHEIPILQKNKGNYTQVKIDKSNKILSLEIGYNPDSHTTNQKHDRPPVVGLMHELGHAESYLNGKGVLYNSENAKYGIGIDVDKGNLNEYNAITKENIVRKILGIKERSYEYYKRKNEIK